MFLWYDIPQLMENNERGIITDELQKEHFMVDEHITKPGFIDDTSWVLVSERFTATHDLNNIFIGSFDLYPEQTNALLQGSSVKPNFNPLDTINDYFQLTYHYIDDVRIDSVGFIDTCDCEELEQDIQFTSETVGIAGQCCRVILLKIANQDTTCRISEFMWDKVDSDPGYDTVNINEIGRYQLPNGRYTPVDTICYDKRFNNSVFEYHLKFKTLGSKEFGCQKNFFDTLDCYELPCKWLGDSLADASNPSKQAVRLDITNLGTNEEGKCCYEIEFVNNSPFNINAHEIELKFLEGEFTTIANEFNFVPYSAPLRPLWFLMNGIDAYTSQKLGTICLEPGADTRFSWNLWYYDGEPKYNCFKTRYEQLTCSVCCPDTKLYKTLIEDGENCCIMIDSMDIGCGDSVTYFNTFNSIESPITLPFELCSDNSDFLFKAKIYNEDTLYCVKSFDLNDEVKDCSCCSNLNIQLMKDIAYTGSGCRYLMNIITGFDKCNIDSSLAEIEYGKVIEGVFIPKATIDYNDYNLWRDTVSNCDTDSLRFNFKLDGDIICTKDYAIQCQTCEGVGVDSIAGYSKTILFGPPGPNTISAEFCCIDIEIQNPDSGSCDFYGLLYINSPIEENINIFENGINIIKSDKDTVTFCAYMGNSSSGAVSGTYAVYDSKGNLVCSFHFEHSCLDTGFVLKEIKNQDINLDQILVDKNDFNIELGQTNKLDYKIFNLAGQLIYQEDNNDNSSSTLNVNTSNLSNGVYSVYILTDTGFIVRIFKVVN